MTLILQERIEPMTYGMNMDDGMIYIQNAGRVLCLGEENEPAIMRNNMSKHTHM